MSALDRMTDADLERVALENARAMAALQKDRDEGARHVRHVLNGPHVSDEFNIRYTGPTEHCRRCRAARTWQMETLADG